MLIISVEFSPEFSIVPKFYVNPLIQTQTYEIKWFLHSVRCCFIFRHFCFKHADPEKDPAKRHKKLTQHVAGRVEADGG